MSSYTSDTNEFRTTMIAEGATPAQIDRLLELADRYQLLALIKTNENVAGKFDVERRQLEAAIRACISGPVKKVIVDSDPRGFAVKLILNSGRSNGVEGFGVPTHDFTATQVTHAANKEPRHWEVTRS
jgi:hypothetical protein